MSYFPHIHLVPNGKKTVIVTGPHLHVLSTHGEVLLSTTTHLDHGERVKVCRSGPVRCIAVDPAFAHIATAGDDKKLKIWKITDALELLSERELPKKPTEVCFTRDGQTIVVSDKFGDVFSYPLHPEPSTTSSSAPPETSKRGSLTSHENPSHGTLILGHASLLTTFLLTPDEKYIITADRDEHIRVSWFPQGYAVERYCLGHEKFVSALHIPSFQPSMLVSGGGDLMLKLWDWMSGKLLADIPVLQTVEPYIKVKAPKRRRGWNDGDEDGDGEGGDDGQSKGTKGKGRRSRGRGKGKGKDQGKQVTEIRDDSAEVDEPAEAAAAEGEQPVADAPAAANDKGEAVSVVPAADVLVFVVHKIRSADRGEHGRFILFSVVGATALFYAPFPVDHTGSASPAGAVQAVDFGVPVIDFTVGQNDGVWVLLDAEWGRREDASLAGHKFARVLSWNDGTLHESLSSDTPLLSTINSKCLVSATCEELKMLDLYSALSSMPKNVDPEHDALIRDTLSEAAAVDPSADGKQLTQRELGRLKKKKALLAKIQEQEKEKEKGDSEERKHDPGEIEPDAEAGREFKRTKSECEDAEGDVRDVEMDAS